MVSVIIINYNTFELTSACIRSVIEKTKETPYEIIVVDNNSTNHDPTDLLKLFPKIRLISESKNLGFAGGNNRGIPEANGDEILLLNSDTEFINDAISITSKILSQNPAAGIATCRLEYPNGVYQRNSQPFPNVLRIWVEKLRLHKLMSRETRSAYMQGFYFNYEQTGKPDWVWGTYFHFRKKILTNFREKKLNEDYFMYMEDMQWCFEARKYGWEILYTPEGRVIHHVGASKGERRASMIKNQNDFLKKYYSSWHKLLLHLSGFNKLGN